ncbi:hypothetical protein [Actinomadura macrotermitis]|uniref:DUF3558 domain-containing protein n=1 Tax=Actinomadura macrotermitis TaxID=2585200 RepID=A0A7K0BWY4_9ACTN|nr:hypothetical protein [Actinomadura macrotermitis]MQY05392.1 hypothetical protein [Actinomadura macrotermitis]
MSETSPQESDRPWWRRGPVVAGTAVAVAATGAFAWWPDTMALAAPKRGADSVPAGMRMEKAKAPARCGVTTRTLKTLLDKEWSSSFPDYPAPSKSKECSWYVDHRSLEVDFSFHDSEAEAMLDFIGSGWPSEAARAEVASERDPRRTVTGLGDEAGLVSAPMGVSRRWDEVLVFFRAGNVLVTVTYGHWWADPAQRWKELSEKDATDGALKAAADVARSMGMPAEPVRAPVPMPAVPVLQNVPQACGALPAKLLRTLAPDATTGPWNLNDTFSSIAFRTPPRVCKWSASKSDGGDDQEQKLTVIIAPVPSPPDRPGFGPWSAAYEYTRLHRLARQKWKGFQPLAGVGEQAFLAHPASFSQLDNGGLVILRSRNVLAAVHYSTTERTFARPYDVHDTGKEIRGAYTAALEVAKKLKS